MYDAFLTFLAGEKNPSPSQILTSLARAYLNSPLTDEEFRRHRQLIVREMYTPTEAFEIVADQTLRPLFETLFGLLKPFLGSELEENLIFEIMSIFGIVLYLNYSRPMITHITGKAYDDTFKTLLIDHIVRFSLNGLSV